MIIEGGTIVNEGRTFKGTVVIDNDRIVDVIEERGERREERGESSQRPTANSQRLKATGCYVLPGIIDEHVHFREPGLTEKADMATESRAAAAGGVTSFFDMPNTVPQTTALEALEEKFSIAGEKSLVNYSFFFGATNDNYECFQSLPANRIPGIKLFMGSSTGNMLVDREEALDQVFAHASRANLPLMAHCEDTGLIDCNMAEFRRHFGDDPEVWRHPLIRSEEACLASTVKAIELAVSHDTRLHVAHVSTARELELFPPNTSWITAEATVGHLYFSFADYCRLGTRIKVNPAIKTFRDRYALRQGLMDGHVTTIGTDHAPHLLSQKEGGCFKAASGMPMIQFSLVTMLELVDEGVLTLEKLVELMCHNPARTYGVKERGYLRKGYKADLVIVRPNTPWTVTPDVIQSKCGWSPMEGHEYQWHVEHTLCNGRSVYDGKNVLTGSTGEAIQFSHT